MHDRGYVSRSERLPLAVEALDPDSLGCLLQLEYPGVVINEMKRFCRAADDLEVQKLFRV
jgi:hypothetical protein